ncbi:carbohydrate-binding family 9 [Octopus vulgaris]|uniref:Carbohydrate-binding family 9 n=1 Tax=Octopus vulgaris TaxID=6645 RepID=A0AA36F0A2_OCTVU|nr:carbohydrate-binding family 9 [Octopus vulgaris]
MKSSYRLYSVLTLVVSTLCLGLGVIIGYFLQITTDPLLLAKDQHACDVGYGSYLPEVQSFLEKNIIEACAAETCDVPLPHTYVVQHLNEETIEIDGLIDEFAWNQVPWSEKFVVFNDNAFEIFLDTAGSFHKYKEIGVNAFSTVWDALLTKAYIDRGEALQNWDSRVNVAVNVDGEVNNPNSQGDFWSVEMSLPFSQLLAGSVKTDTKPHNLEIWYANFARSHIQASAHGDHYHPKYKALFGSYVSDITQLDLPPYINNKMCTPAPQITLDWRGFVVSLTPDKGQLQPIHIRADRFVWFGHIDKLGKNY